MTRRSLDSPRNYREWRLHLDRLGYLQEPRIDARLDEKADASDLVSRAPAENGFADRASSVMSFDDSTRTFSIQPAVSAYAITVQTTRYTKDALETVVIPDTEGLHYIYFDGVGALHARRTHHSTRAVIRSPVKTRTYPR